MRFLYKRREGHYKKQETLGWRILKIIIRRTQHKGGELNPRLGGSPSPWVLLFPSSFSSPASRDLDREETLSPCRPSFPSFWPGTTYHDHPDPSHLFFATKKTTDHASIFFSPLQEKKEAHLHCSLPLIFTIFPWLGTLEGGAPSAHPRNPYWAKHKKKGHLPQPEQTPLSSLSPSTGRCQNQQPSLPFLFPSINTATILTNLWQPLATTTSPYTSHSLQDCTRYEQRTNQQPTLLLPSSKLPLWGLALRASSSSINIQKPPLCTMSMHRL